MIDRVRINHELGKRAKVGIVDWQKAHRHIITGAEFEDLADRLQSALVDAFDWGVLITKQKAETEATP